MDDGDVPPDVMKKVVVIGEDDEPIATLLRDSINDEAGYQAVVVSDGALVLASLVDAVRDRVAVTV